MTCVNICYWIEVVLPENFVNIKSLTDSGRGKGDRSFLLERGMIWRQRTQLIKGWILKFDIIHHTLNKMQLRITF